MVIEYIRYGIPEERRAQFERAYGEAAAVLDAPEHCLRYEVSHGVEESEHHVAKIERGSIEGHEQGFGRSPELAAVFASVRPFSDDIQEMRYYGATPIRGGDA